MIHINGGLGEINIIVPDGNLKLVCVMEDLKNFIETNGIDELIKRIKQ
jgi:hypothetical protein